MLLATHPISVIFGKSVYNWEGKEQILVSQAASMGQRREHISSWSGYVNGRSAKTECGQIHNDFRKSIWQLLVDMSTIKSYLATRNGRFA